MLRARRALLGSRAAALLRLLAAGAAPPAIGGGGGEEIPAGERGGEQLGEAQVGVDGDSGGGSGESGDLANAAEGVSGNTTEQPLSRQAACRVAGDDDHRSLGADCEGDAAAGSTGASTMAGADPAAEAAAGAPNATRRDPAADAQPQRCGATAPGLATAAAALAAIVGAGACGGGAEGGDEVDDLERALTTAAALVEGLRRTLYEVRMHTHTRIRTRICTRIRARTHTLLVPKFRSFVALKRQSNRTHAPHCCALWSASANRGRRCICFLTSRPFKLIYNSSPMLGIPDPKTSFRCRLRRMPWPRSRPCPSTATLRRRRPQAEPSATWLQAMGLTVPGLLGRRGTARSGSAASAFRTVRPPPRPCRRPPPAAARSCRRRPPAGQVWAVWRTPGPCHPRTRQRRASFGGSLLSHWLAAVQFCKMILCAAHWFFCGMQPAVRGRAGVSRAGQAPARLALHSPGQSPARAPRDRAHSHSKWP